MRTAETARSRHPLVAGLRGAARNAWVRHLARAGFYAKSIVYLVIAVLALSLALGAGGQLVDSRGAITTISQRAPGSVAVLVLAVALSGLALWFIVDGLADPDHLRGSGFGWVLRIGQAIGGIGYVVLAVWTFSIFFGDADMTSTDELTKSWTGRVLSWPGGTVLVFAVGAIVTIVGIRQMSVGWRRVFLHPLDLRRASAAIRQAIWLSGIAGFTAQGLVFALVGLFFCQAAVERQAWEATGFDGALGFLARQRHGVALLTVVSLGLLAYAAFAAFEGHYRRYGRR